MVSPLINMRKTGVTQHGIHPTCLLSLDPMLTSHMALYPSHRQQQSHSKPALAFPTVPLTQMPLLLFLSSLPSSQPRHLQPHLSSIERHDAQRTHRRQPRQARQGDQGAPPRLVCGSEGEDANADGYNWGEGKGEGEGWEGRMRVWCAVAGSERGWYRCLEGRGNRDPCCTVWRMALMTEQPHPL